ncbi:hypothetical protein ATCM_06695 [Stenotrophomonas sp. ATCM1_4]|uniref:ESPR-type extended signal peptide-containing protein n=1 Tax=Stenotrophomonas sp. ATCM1_4 TaxID=2259330 RepID=UPI00104AE356|nr:ESPR-type extended signal peptide-containing protein [Stenotrophomonas sp. ATCM1_4]TDB27371.1 hypothetical protein ATCM_06695 [Stenotrophomonas sp. ATCM1_4]
MNLIYKLVWNSTLGAFMVASELASGKGKIASKPGRAQRSSLNALTAVLISLLATSTAYADATKLGTGSSATAASASNTAIGYYAKAEATAWVIGTFGNRRVDGLGLNISSSSPNASSVALGDMAEARNFGTMALGSRSVASSVGALATGTYANALGRNSIAHGTAAYASGTQAISFGTFSVANAARAAAFGTNATATGADATAIGTSSTASGARAIALGSALTGGEDATDTKQNITNQTRATGTDSIALGTSANATGNDAIAMGRAASVTVKNAIAIGANASATHEGSVALGSGSTTTANLGATAYTSQSGASLAGAIAAGEVSVGSAAQKRRLTNVAAGAEGSDAVNVSQLQAEANKSNATAAGIATAIGGGAAYNADTGTFSAPSLTVGGQPVGSLSDAITHIDGRTVSNATAIDALTTNLNNGTVGLVKQDADSLAIGVAIDKAGTLVNFASTDGARTLTGIKAGGQSLDAVNVAQLQAIAAGLGGGATVNADGSITGPSYSVTNADGTTHTATNLGEAIAHIDDRVADSSTKINDLDQQIKDGAVGLVKQDAATGDITVAADKGGATVNFAGTQGARTLDGIAAGAVHATSRQAVNGAQLHATMPVHGSPPGRWCHGGRRWQHLCTELYRRRQDRQQRRRCVDRYRPAHLAERQRHQRPEERPGRCERQHGRHQRSPRWHRQHRRPAGRALHSAGVHPLRRQLR